MLTEHFIASIGAPSKSPASNLTKDAAIFLHEFQPLVKQSTVCRKSATWPNCLAVSETHVFAAQADKGVIHVYEREKGKQEATVPFPERISSITLACNDSVLIIGTVEGRLFLWELATGRQVATGQAHLQAISALAVDATANFLLSASKDSTIHTWSLPALLSFANTSDVVPLTTFSSHHAEITALVIGHGSSSFNFAASVSKDRTCLVWNYRTNSILRTYLLPGPPCAAALDPADRAIYLGYEDGSVQLLDLYSSSLTTIDAVLAADNPLEPIQPPAASRWSVPDGSSPGAALSVSVSYDGSTVVSGHQSGSILSWDVGRGGSPSNIIQTPLPGPVTNLSFLPVTGWPNNVQSKHRLRINEIVKPKFGAFDVSDAGVVPGTYAFQVQFTSDIKPAESTSTSSFHQALTAATFPTALLDHGLAELSTWGTTGARPHGTGEAVIDDDYIALDADTGKKPSMEEENAKLRVQLEALQRVQKKSIEKIGQLSEERRALRTAIQAGKKSNGVADEDSSD